jgi:radical SAM protein with 4Fe4S-binding SPASM domain
LYRRLERDVHPLRYLFLEITRRCNLACRHCGSDCDREARPGELSTAEWLWVIDQVARDFDRSSLAVVLTGGEPLCHPELDEILRALARNGLAWGLVTNGWWLTPKNIGRLRAAGMASITVSLDGLQASHDWLRGRAGSFERALEGLRGLAEQAPRFFDVVTCVHPGNLGELSDVQELLRQVGVPIWRLFPIFPKGRALASPELLLGPGGFEGLLRFIAEARRAEADRTRRGEPAMSVELTCEGFLPEAWDRAVRSEPYFCRAGISVASVLHDGAVGACPNISRRLVQGDIRKDPLAWIWEERFGPYRDRSWLKGGQCASCQDFDRCQGNSLHLWDEERQGCGLCTRELLGSPAP